MFGSEGGLSEDYGTEVTEQQLQDWNEHIKIHPLQAKVLLAFLNLILGVTDSTRSECIGCNMLNRTSLLFSRLPYSFLDLSDRLVHASCSLSRLIHSYSPLARVLAYCFCSSAGSLAICAEFLVYNTDPILGCCPS